jgi:hypothetical protein
MPEVILWRPFQELKLPDQLRFSHWQSFLLAAVNAAPRRPVRGSGKLANGHLSLRSFPNRFIRSALIAGVNPFRI